VRRFLLNQLMIRFQQQPAGARRMRATIAYNEGFFPHGNLSTRR
jgi:hypothetical protein